MATDAGQRDQGSLWLALEFGKNDDPGATECYPYADEFIASTLRDHDDIQYIKDHIACRVLSLACPY